MSMDSNRKVNQKLKHFEIALRTTKNDNKFYQEQIIRKLGSLNNKIAESNCLKLCHPELIGSTGLHLAYRERNLQIFNVILAQGTDYTSKNQNGLTILHLVLECINNPWYRHSNNCMARLEDSFITAILAAHIQYKQTENSCDPNGFSHFHAACATDNVGTVKFFLDNGVSIHDGVDANKPYFPSYTPLHFAVRYFSLRVVDVLLKLGANLNVKDAKEMTPLQILLERNIEMTDINRDLQSFHGQERYLKIARLLLKNIGSNDTRIIIDDLGLTSLHVACALMDMPTVEQLLEKVSDINYCVNFESPQWAGYTTLHFAAIFNVNIVKSLVKRGADLQAKNAKGVHLWIYA